MSGRTTVVAHRGGAGHAVENTIEALESAAGIGAHAVEIDVQQTGDGGIVVFHDPDLRRLGGRPDRVAQLSTRELTGATLRQGTHRATVPTLSDFVARARELDMPIVVELKVRGDEHGDVVADVVAALQGAPAGTRLQSFDAASVSSAAQRFPHLPAGWITRSRRGQAPTGAAFVAYAVQTATRRRLARTQEAGLERFVWTANSTRSMRRLIDVGIEGLITDRPALALAHLN